MEPVAVGVERIFDGVVINGDIVSRGKSVGGVAPGVTLHGEKVDIATIICVVEQGMGKLVEECWIVGIACIDSD